MMKYCFGDDREFLPVEVAENFEREVAELREALQDAKSRINYLISYSGGEGDCTDFDELLDRTALKNTEPTKE